MKKIFIVLLFAFYVFPQEMELVGVKGGSVTYEKQIAIAGSHFYVANAELGFFYTNDTAIIREIKVPMSFGTNYFSTSQIDTNLLFFNSFLTHLKTSNAGNTWSPLHTNSSENWLYSFNVINQHNPNIVYGIRNGNEIWKSLDKGETWSLIRKFRNKVHSIAIAPSDTNYVYCTADNSIYLSTNAGGSWAKKLSDTTYPILKIAINPQNKNTVYFDRDAVFYKSVSNGSDPIASKVNFRSYDICINPVDTNIVFSAARTILMGEWIYGLYRSTDDCKTWVRLTNGFTENYRCFNIVMDKNNPFILYSGLENLGVLKSYNNGDYWFPTDLSFTYNSDIHFFSKNSFLVSSSGWGIWKTNNRADSWYRPLLNSKFYFGHPTEISFSKHKKNIGICGWSENYPLRTTDFGETWDTLSLGINSKGGAFVTFNEFYPGLVFLTGINDGGLGPNLTARSTDFGATWEMLSDECYGKIFSDYTDSTIIYSVFGHKLQKSTNFGNNWLLVKEFEETILDLKADKNGNFYAIYPYGNSGSGGLLMSTNKGVIWNHIDQKLSLLDHGMAVNVLWVDPVKTGRIYVGLDSKFEQFTSQYTNGGLFLTDDYGQNWRRVYDSRIFSIGKDPDTPGYLYIGTQYGIMRYLDTLTVTDINETSGDLPERYAIQQNYPNPFNPFTTIEYSIPERGKVSVKVYDVLGSEIADLVNEEKQAGRYKIDFNASKLPSGVYFYRINSGKYSETRKMMLLK